MTTLRLLTVFLLGSAWAEAQPAPGFMVDLRPLESNTLPALHSFVLAADGGRWLVAGGRTNGLHHFVESTEGGTNPPPNAFPPSLANNRIWVIEPASAKVWSSTVQNLSPAISDQLSATNAQGYQDGNTLYVVGGYGLDRASGQMTTFGSVAAIQVKETIDAVVQGQPLDRFIQQTQVYTSCPDAGTTAYNTCQSDPAVVKKFNCQQYVGTPQWAKCTEDLLAFCRTRRSEATTACIRAVGAGNRGGIPTGQQFYLKVAGGALEKVGTTFYLIFGQQFEGLYSVNEGDYGKWPVSQVYTRRAAAFQFTPNPLRADLLNVVLQDPNDAEAPFNRRDLNVLPNLNPADAAPRIGVYGGVFRPGRDQAYQEPIFVENVADPAAFTVRVDGSHKQMMNQYDCARIPLYDRGNRRMIALFIGGISLYYLDAKTRRLRMDEGLPFVQDVSALMLGANGRWSEFVRSQPLDSRMGTNAVFIPDEAIPAASNGVLYLDAVKPPQRIGWVFGGILSDTAHSGSPSGVGSRASNALYEVWLTPQTADPVWLPAAAAR